MSADCQVDFVGIDLGLGQPLEGQQLPGGQRHLRLEGLHPRRVVGWFQLAVSHRERGLEQPGIEADVPFGGFLAALRGFQPPQDLLLQVSQAVPPRLAPDGAGADSRSQVFGQADAGKGLAVAAQLVDAHGAHHLLDALGQAGEQLPPGFLALVQRVDQIGLDGLGAQAQQDHQVV